MVDLVIVGSIAYDSIKTPFGSVSEVLGGSATYAAIAASFFAKPGIVAVVGDDFNDSNVFDERGISTKGIKVAAGRTFRWSGYYEYDMNLCHTTETQLNVFQGFTPELPHEYKNARYVFLGNIQPELQLHVLEQLSNPVVIADTMNYWIEKKPEQLKEVIKKSSIFLLNESEARQLMETTNLIKAGRKLLSYGLESVVIKKGEHGVLLFTNNGVFLLPGYPLENVYDPTGAGDSFAGAFCGYLAKNGLSEDQIRKAIVYGSAAASFNVEAFGLQKLLHITNKDIEQRYKEFELMMKF